MKVLKITACIVLLILIIAVAVINYLITDHFIVDRDSNYQARMHYLPKVDVNNDSSMDDLSFWPLSRINNPFMEQGPYLVSYPVFDRSPVAAIIICPGGGYWLRSEKEEGIEIAEWLNQQGIAAFVLNYRLRPHPAPLNDAQQAIRYLRHHADQFNIDPQRIGMMGFSAGGHLTANASTLYESANPESSNQLMHYSSKPNFSILAYAAISMSEVPHQGSLSHLLGDNPSAELIQRLSAEQQVNKDTPPAFIWASETDSVVPVKHSRMYSEALQTHNIPMELHIFPEGRHGSGLAEEEDYAREWPKLMLNWLKKIDIVKIEFDGSSS